MITAMRASMALASLLWAFPSGAQAPYADDPRVYTLNLGSPRQATSRSGYQTIYPGQSYVPAYRDPAANYADAYRSYRSPIGSQGGGSSAAYPREEFLAAYRYPTTGYGSPTYLGRGMVYPNTYRGNISPYMSYQGQPYGSGRAFRYYAPPTYQPRRGGMFDR